MSVGEVKKEPEMQDIESCNSSHPKLSVVAAGGRFHGSMSVMAMFQQMSGSWPHGLFIVRYLLQQQSGSSSHLIPVFFASAAEIVR